MPPSLRDKSSSLPLRPLGTTGIHVSPIGLGTVKIGRNQGVKYPQPFDLPSSEQVAELLGTAAELGINLIDTAPAYGASEERLGEILAANAWFGSRDRWILATKAGEEFENGTSRFDFSADAVTTSVHRSLRRLRTEFLDIVLIHSDGRDADIIRDGGAIDALTRLRDAGLVRAIGISIKSVEGGLLALNAAPERTHVGNWCNVLMVTLNTHDATMLPVIREAHTRGVGILIKKGLSSGNLPPASNAQPDNQGAAPGGRDPVAQAFSYIFHTAGNAVSSVIVGTLKPTHLRHNAHLAATLI